ncbi:MAG: tRNA lysidine(34) synthetase TilS [Chloroflexota bacterium]|nr:tRNA lysidine(34) synthetase TilS [Chloroflexota bacterium]
MTDVLKQVRRTIETYSLLVPGDVVIVAVSGGPDSLCLLHVLLRLGEEYRLRLHVAHLHHGARGAEADTDADFVAEIAAEWNLPVTIERQDIPALARTYKLAFEETARRVRYTFLSRVANEIGAYKIAVGHNADDQAETVLMHFLRGAGMAGLRGMLPLTPITDYRLLEPFTKQETGLTVHSTPSIIRPLLEVPRSDIERYCTTHALTPRFDRSNLDTTYFRNRIRHELLPLLETYNPKVRARLRHTSAVVAADYELLTQLQEQAWAKAVQEEQEATILFNRVTWRALPVALQRATLRQAAYRLRRSLRDVNFVHIEHARQVGLRGETGAQATLPMGLALTVGYDTLTVGNAGDIGPPPDEPLLWSTEPLHVQVPGRTPLPQSDWTLQAEMLNEWDAVQIAANPDPWTTYLDAARLTAPLALRSRRRGDYFRPQGMGRHSVKLSALLINLKIPRAWRDYIPLLVAGDEIIWVCGRRIGEKVTIGAETRRVARLQFKRTLSAQGSRNKLRTPNR